MTTSRYKRALALAGFIALLSTACQKYEGNKILAPAPEKSTVQNLAGKDPATVLAAKYNSAVLNCTLMVVHGNEIPATAKPDDTFSLDLMKATSGPGVVTLKAEKDDLAVTVKLSFDDLRVFDTTLYGHDGVTYSAQRSPYFKYDVEFSETQKSTGSNFGGVYRATDGATERITSTIVNMTRTIEGDEVPYLERGECVITTDIKPAYANQFKPIQAP